MAQIKHIFNNLKERFRFKGKNALEQDIGSYSDRKKDTQLELERKKKVIAISKQFNGKRTQTKLQIVLRDLMGLHNTFTSRCRRVQGGQAMERRVANRLCTYASARSLLEEAARPASLPATILPTSRSAKSTRSSEWKPHMAKRPSPCLAR